VFSYNPGVATTGCTSPLWALLVAPLAALTKGNVDALIAAVLVLGALCYVPMARLGDAITVKLRFSAHRDAYAQIVAREQGDPSGEGVHERAGERYFVDAGPPLRIAFIWPGGAIDNWCGAVYDPSGVVVAPLSERTDLFGGDLFFCEELEAPYYQCCFT